MARLLNDDLAPATGGQPVAAAPWPASGAGLAALTGRALVVGGLLAGLAVGLLLAAVLAGPVRQGPDLAGLLRTMALIKGLILAAAAALVWVRLRWPVRTAILAGYAGALGLAAAGLGWLWGLSLVPLGAAMFWGGLAAAFWVANRDGDLLSPRSSRRA